MANIYCYDTTGRMKFPIQVSNHKLTTLKEDSIDSNVSMIEDGSLGLIVITDISNFGNDVTFVTTSEEDKKRIEDLLDDSDFGKVVATDSTYGWFTTKCSSVVIISDKVGISTQEFEYFVKEFFEINGNGESKREVIIRDVIMNQPETVDRYYVINVRNSANSIEAPNLTYAKQVCDTNPCCVVKNGKGEIVHRSRYGVVNVSNKTNVTQYDRQSSNVVSNGEMGVFNVRI